MQGAAKTFHMSHLNLPILRLPQQIKGALCIGWIILD
jgi:hypothetical protein